MTETTDLPPDPDAAAAETQAHIPEFKRESGGLPWLGIAVIFILALAGSCLLIFALVYGQGESEDRAIDSTVASVLAFTHTPTVTRATTSTPVSTITPVPSDTPVVPTETPIAGPTLTFTATVTNTRPAVVQATQPIVPSATP